MTNNCITSLPNAPLNTLVAEVRSWLGQNHVTRALATSQVAFDATNGSVVEAFSLLADTSMTLAQGTAGLILQTTAPLTVVTTVVTVSPPSTVTNTFTVNSILLLDEATTTVMITNPNASGGSTITGRLYYVPNTVL